MDWKVKELQEWCKNQHPEDIVKFYYWDYDVRRLIDICDLETRKPKRTEFEHCECKHCEPVKIKGNERLYCNKMDDVIDKYSTDSCDNFEHKEIKDLRYLED